jgi:hypothetical protein
MRVKRSFSPDFFSGFTADVFIVFHINPQDSA